jgi:hypothetical protein
LFALAAIHSFYQQVALAPRPTESDEDANFPSPADLRMSAEVHTRNDEKPVAQWACVKATARVSNTTGTEP